MTLSDLTDLLRAHRVFGLLDEAAFVDLAALFDVEDCPAGAPVSSEDAAGERLGWVLSGAISLTPSAWRFSRLVLNAGLMQSSGQIEVSRDLQLRGRMDVQMRGRADHTAMPILISGPLKSPLTQTAGH